MFAEVLLTLLVLVVTRQLWLRWKYDLHKIPSTPGFPLIGHTLELAQRIENGSKWFRTQHQSLGCPKIMKAVFLNKPTVFVTDMDCAKSVISHRTDLLPRHPMYKPLTKPATSNENEEDILFCTNDAVYARHIRKSYSSGLTTSQMKKSFPKIQKVLNHMMDVIETKRQHGLIDFQKLCIDFTLDAIGVIVFEKELGGLEGSGCIHKRILAVAANTRTLLLNPFAKLRSKIFPNSKIAKETVEVQANLKQEWDDLTQEVLAKPDPPEGETPIWYNLKTMIDPTTNKRLTYEKLRSEIATVIIAGMDTTGHQLSWILGMIATHPHIEEGIVKELKEQNLFGPGCREIEFEDLANLSYLNAVIKEGFRVAYIAPSTIPRIASNDMTLLGYRIPKGIDVILPGNRAVNTVSDWGDPGVVRPERWLTKDEDMSSKYFLMFGYGPRDCPGQKLAMAEIRLAIVMLLSKYCITSDKPFEAFLENTVDRSMIECRAGMLLNVTPRPRD